MYMYIYAITCFDLPEIIADLVFKGSFTRLLSMVLSINRIYESF